MGFFYLVQFAVQDSNLFFIHGSRYQVTDQLPKRRNILELNVLWKKMFPELSSILQNIDANNARKEKKKKLLL